MSALPNPLTNEPYTMARWPSARTEKRNVPQYCQLSADAVWANELFAVDVSEVQSMQAILQQATPIQSGQTRSLVAEARSYPPRVRPQTPVSPEVDWLRANSQALRNYRGEWLLILGNELISRSADFRAIRAAITERRIQSPFVYYVPTEEESNFLLI